MKPLYFTLHTRLQLIIFPDVMAHLNGHTVITHTYSIFKDNGRNSPRELFRKESEMHLDDNRNPDYLGYLRFEVPDKLFIYTSADLRKLQADEVEELIEWLTHVRENPSLWP